MSHDLVRVRRDADDREGGELQRALRSHVDGEVRFDRGGRALYATDASNYRIPPIGVVIPKTVEHALTALAICREHDVPVLPRGGGTSLAGQCCNRAVVIDCSRHLTRTEIDPSMALARVQPGVVLDDLRKAAASYGLTFGPDPATHNRCTLGGMLGNNSCGVHSLLSEFYGPGPRTSDQVESLEVVTYGGARLRAKAMSSAEIERCTSEPGRAGEILLAVLSLRARHDDAIRTRFPNIPRRVSGYNLPALLDSRGFHLGQALTGSEATCVFIAEATVKLIPERPNRVLVVVGFEDVFRAGDAVAEAREHKPVACEGMDGRLIDQVRKLGWDTAPLDLLPEGNAWLLIEHGAETLPEARAAAERTRRAFAHGSNVCVFEDAESREKIWELRESGLGVTAFTPDQPDAWPGWEDAAVPPEVLGKYLREFDRLMQEHQVNGALYGHFGHGCIHTRINFDLRSDAGVETFRSFTESAARLVAKYGGSLSGEHGDGQARADLLEVMYGPEIVGAFREFKAIWDPDNRMNPGKVVSPAGRTEHLRLRDYHPEPGPIQLHLDKDGYDFGHAATRCVGVGLCRKTDSGTMCPSYMVTRDERHSTRGRSRLLWEMMRGDVIQDGWRSEEVREALDLCLNCKACKSECPVNVDMAAYKAEFMYHHYDGKFRSRDAYVFGMIQHWSRLGGYVPRLANFLTSARGLSPLMKALAGVASDRPAPRFADKPFRRSFVKKPSSGRRVLLWPDTFNDAFYPEILQAAVDVLNHAGYDVDIPREHLCCGRTMMEHGWLDRIRGGWLHILDELAQDIDSGVPVIGIEPSCTVMFRDELRQLLPEVARAKRLSQQTFTLAEFLNSDESYRPPSVSGRAVYHYHCQHRAVIGVQAEPELLRKCGLALEVLDYGCCGMAGAFGFQKRTFPLSKALGQRGLIPKVQEVAATTTVMADGFSCREQIRSLANVRALHIAEVLAQALRGPGQRAG